MGDEFNILAAKVLSGEATKEEQARLQILLAQNEGLRKEFAALEATWKSLRSLGPLVSSLSPAPASIPEERLKQLQQAVRDDAEAKAVAKSNQPGSLRRRNRQVSFPMSALVQNWLERHLGRASALVSFALLIVLMSVVYLMNRPAPNAGAIDSSPAAAYLLSNHGRPEVRRDGLKIAARTITPLSFTDEVYLPPGSEADIITPEQVFRFQGPRTIEAAALAGAAVASNVESNLTAQTKMLRSVLFKPVQQLLAANLLVTTRSAQGIPLYSPLGATASLTPLILWKSRLGETYDLRITDEFNTDVPPWTLVAAYPPVDFAKVEAWKDRPLSKDGLYRLRVSRAGRPLTSSEHTFRIVEDTGSGFLTASPDLLLAAYKLLIMAPSRIGDALALLLRLPPEQANTEMALRLKLMIFGELGYQEDFDAAVVGIRSRLAKDR